MKLEDDGFACEHFCSGVLIDANTVITGVEENNDSLINIFCYESTVFDLKLCSQF